MPLQRSLFQKLLPWYLTLTLTDDLDFVTKKKRFYPKEYKCEIWKLYHLPFKSYDQCNFFMYKQTDRRTDQKLNATDLLMREHKKDGNKGYESQRLSR